MSPRAIPAVLALACAAAAAFPQGLGAQGSLTPPGAPDVSMRTLSQVQPRIPIDTLPSSANGKYVVSAPGIYYLTSPISRGTAAASIYIASSDVTIDLNGFGIVETSTPTIAIYIDRTVARGNIRIMNGSISGPNVTAVASFGGTFNITNLLLADLEIRSTDGLGGVCSLTNLFAPIALRVQFSSMRTGIDFAGSGTISSCTGSLISSPNAITVLSADLIEGSTINTATGTSVTGISGTTVRGCSVFNLVGTSAAGNAIGISASTVVDCTARTIGAGSSVSGAVGISGSLVRGCNVNSVGAAAVTGNVIGINSANSEDSSVSSLNGAGTIYGVLGTLVSRCYVSSLTQAAATANCYGIFARTAAHCQIFSIAGNSIVAATGISAASVIGCRVATVSNSGSGEGNGITAAEAPTMIAECAVTSVKNHGVTCAFAGQIRDSSFSSCGNGASVTDGAGVFMNTADLRVDSCTVNGSDVGVRVAVDATSNLIVRNSVTNCTTAFSTITNTRIGPIVSGAGGTISNTNPWANFTQ